MPEYLTHHLIVTDNDGKEFKVIILENTKVVMTTCTCNGTQKCIHVCLCLSGKPGSIMPEYIVTQQTIFERLSQTKEGKENINNALQRIETNRREDQPFQRFLKRFSRR